MSIMKIDGIVYNVGELRPVTRSAPQQIDQVTAGVLQNGREICDIIGVKYDFEMTVEPRREQDYNDFYYDITKPLTPRIVTLPFGDETITFPARIIVDNDVLRGIKHGNIWGGLKLKVVAMESARQV